MKINQRLTLCFSLLFSLLSISYTSAQQLNISGVVISSEDNEPLIGATVSVKGNPTKGVITDINGQFQLSVEAGTKMLVVSYVGMKHRKYRKGTCGFERVRRFLSCGCRLPPYLEW